VRCQIATNVRRGTRIWNEQSHKSYRPLTVLAFRLQRILGQRIFDGALCAFQQLLHREMRLQGAATNLLALNSVSATCFCLSVIHKGRTRPASWPSLYAAPVRCQGGLSRGAGARARPAGLGWRREDAPQWRGVNPIPFHAANILLHALVTCLVFRRAPGASAACLPLPPGVGEPVWPPRAPPAAVPGRGGQCNWRASACTSLKPHLERRKSVMLSVDAQGNLGRWMHANMPGRVGSSCCQQAESLSGGSRRLVRARLALRLCAARDGGEPGPGPPGWPQAPGANALRSAGAPRSSSAAVASVWPAGHAHVVRAACILIHAPLHVAYHSSARWVTPGPWLGMIVRHGACAMLLHSMALRIAMVTDR